MQTTKNKRISPTQAAKARVKAVKPQLPLAWRKIFYQHYPSYKQEPFKRLLENVFAGNSSDIFITEVLEKIAAGKLKLIQ